MVDGEWLVGFELTEAQAPAPLGCAGVVFGGSRAAGVEWRAPWLGWITDLQGSEWEEVRVGFGLDSWMVVGTV